MQHAACSCGRGLVHNLLHWFTGAPDKPLLWGRGGGGGAEEVRVVSGRDR